MTFTSTSDLGEWEERVVDRVTPLLDAVEGRGRVDSDSLVGLPEPLRRMLYHVIEDVGRGNLFGGVQGRSEVTLLGAVQVAEIAESAGIAVPALGPFRRSPFSEYHGWGDRHDRLFFVVDLPRGRRSAGQPPQSQD